MGKAYLETSVVKLNLDLDHKNKPGTFLHRIRMPSAVSLITVCSGILMYGRSACGR